MKAMNKIVWIVAALVAFAAPGIAAESTMPIIYRQEALFAGLETLTADTAIQYNLVDALGLTTATFRTKASGGGIILSVVCFAQADILSGVQIKTFPSFQSDIMRGLGNTTAAKTGYPCRLNETVYFYVDAAKPYLSVYSGVGSLFSLFRVK
jgi:hypothetical protein